MENDPNENSDGCLFQLAFIVIGGITIGIETWFPGATFFQTLFKVLLVLVGLGILLLGKNNDNDYY